MRVAYISDIHINKLASTYGTSENLSDYYHSIFLQIVEQCEDIDYLIFNGGIYDNCEKLLSFVEYIQKQFQLRDLKTVVRFNVANTDYYSNTSIIDKVGRFYEIDTIFKNHNLYLPRNPIITSNVWLFGIDTWYDYTLYRGEPISLQEITKKDNRSRFTRLFKERVNFDNFNITDPSDYAFGLDNTFDVKHTKDCVDAFRYMCDKYDRTIAQPVQKIVCGYFYSNSLFLSDNPKRDGYYDAFSGSLKFDDTFKSHGITEYVCGKNGSYRSHVKRDGILYRNSATSLRKRGLFVDDCILGDVLVVTY